MKVAVQLWTVRDSLQDAARVPGVLGRLREIGYDAVEVAALPREAEDAFGAHLAAAGMTACAAHVPLEELNARAAEVGERCRRWGCEYAVVPSLPAEYHSAAGFERFAAEAVELASALESFGVRLAYHNHAFELERWHGRTGLEILLGGTLEAELDTYWLQFAGANPISWIRRLSARVPLVHLKDMAIHDGRQVQAEVGEGNLDWPAVLDACAQAGTRWLVVEQDECAGDPFASLATSRRNLGALLARRGSA